MHKVITKPTLSPLSLTELKNQLGVLVTDTARDSVLQANISAATAAAEKYLERPLMAQTIGYYASSFGQCDEAINLKMDLTAVSSIHFYNIDGALTLLDQADYVVDLNASRVFASFGHLWPVVRNMPNAVEIRYVSGYQAVDDVPADIKKALLIIACQWENYQGAVELGQAVKTLPYAALQLLSPYKDYRQFF